MNVTRDLQEAFLDEYMTTDLGECSDPENFVPDIMDEIEYEYDNLYNFQKHIEKFENDQQIFNLNSKEFFYFAILYGVVYSQLENKGFEFSEDGQVIVDMMGSGFFDRLKEKQERLYLNLNQLSTFN